MVRRLAVGEIMSRPVITLAEDDTLWEARSCMERGRVRHLPVVRGTTLVGLVTHRDLLQASFSLFADGDSRQEHRVLASVPVRELMHDAVAVNPETPARQAATLMLERKFGCLPVVDGTGHLVGIITEADFLTLAVRMLAAIEP
jgi:CBS domain-containing membrane protein